MNTNTLLDRIKVFSDLRGPSGFEDEVLVEIEKQTKGYADFTRDSMLNAYLTFKNQSHLVAKDRSAQTRKKPVVMLDAHSDEVGLMVKSVEKNGMIEFVTLGGWIATSLVAQPFEIRTREGQWIHAIVASKPPHFMSEEERKKAVDVTNLRLDVGASTAEEVTALGILPGAPCVPAVSCRYDSARDLLCGKAFDNRLGTAAVVSVMEQLATREGAELAVDVVGAVATQEEVGCRGAQVSSHRVNPDIAIVFEGTPADDGISLCSGSQTLIGKGPMLRHIDARMITNPRFQRFAMEVAEKTGIPMQTAIRTGGGTNGGVIHVAELGIPCIVIGIPVRYIHSHSGFARFEDFQNGIKLAQMIIERLSADVIESF